MLEPFDYERVFREGQRFGAQKIVEVRPIGELVIVSGKLVACDPSWLNYSSRRCLPFVRSVPKGAFAAMLAFAKEPKWKAPLEAAALVRFAPGRVSRWEMALRPKEKVQDLGPGMFFGYGVDSGTGCFADARATLAYSKQWTSQHETLEASKKKGAAWRKVGTPAVEKALFENIHDRDRRKKRTNMVIDSRSGANMVAFHSGMGDGAYPSFWGVDTKGRVLALVTDFLVLPREDVPEEPWHMFDQGAKKGVKGLRLEGSAVGVMSPVERRVATLIRDDTHEGADGNSGIRPSFFDERRRRVSPESASPSNGVAASHGRWPRCAPAPSAPRSRLGTESPSRARCARQVPRARGCSTRVSRRSARPSHAPP